VPLSPPPEPCQNINRSGFDPPGNHQQTTMNPSYITPVFVLIGFALFFIQIVHEYYRRELNKPTALDHAARIFPHANETKQTYQKRL